MGKNEIFYMHLWKSLAGLLVISMGVGSSIPQAIAQTKKEHFVIESSRAQLGSTALRTGQLLAGADQLTVLAGGKVVVLCLNETEATFTSTAKVLSKCPSTQVRETDGRSLAGVVWDWFRGKPLPNSIQDARAGLANLPYVISPRKSKILTTRPRIHWNQVEGAEAYTVQLSSPTTEVISWEITAEELNYQYPLAQPALVLGETYSIKITTSNFIASTEDGQTVTIEVLDEAKQQELFGLLKELRQLDLSAQTEIILESILYEEYELYSQAIAILSGYMRENPNALDIRERLAELYGRIGLPREEQQQYEEIIGRSPGQITEIRMRALNRLADFAEGNEEEAIAAKYRAEGQQISQQLGY
ncbi:hypothetical protein Lepto7376_4552 [[Leptolyngbya] sp. PCC 7376]|nr:hypothetical protein Lepto7376_4552 [[Leptolyngbya] sp. PCC 7376]